MIGPEGFSMKEMEFMVECYDMCKQDADRALKVYAH